MAEVMTYMLDMYERERQEWCAPGRVPLHKGPTQTWALDLAKNLPRQFTLSYGLAVVALANNPTDQSGEWKGKTTRRKRLEIGMNVGRKTHIREITIPD
nr:hypothetical protein Iba_chr03cCG3240 [Ipomoea batatas]